MKNQDTYCYKKNCSCPAGFDYSETSSVCENCTELPLDDAIYKKTDYIRHNTTK
jgi:hypothetical protein